MPGGIDIAPFPATLRMTDTESGVTTTADTEASGTIPISHQEDIMNDARELIATFLELNRSEDRKIGYFTSALVGMFGTDTMFDEFLENLDRVLVTESIPEPLRTRATNLVHTFIPQVAGFNKIEDLAYQDVTVDQLRAISTATPQKRSEGVRTILIAFMKVLDTVVNAA